MTECTNPSKPCRVHDHRSEWHIEVGRRAVHSGWLVAAVAVVIFLSAVPWFSNLPTP